MAKNVLQRMCQIRHLKNTSKFMNVYHEKYISSVIFLLVSRGSRLRQQLLMLDVLC